MTTKAVVPVVIAPIAPNSVWARPIRAKTIPMVATPIGMTRSGRDAGGMRLMNACNFCFMMKWFSFMVSPALGGGEAIGQSCFGILGIGGFVFGGW